LQCSYVSEGYLEAMAIGVLEGRTFHRSDDEAGAPVVVVNQRFANRFWRGESALDRTVRTAGEEGRVIGGVETGKYRSLGEEPTECMYFRFRRHFRFDVGSQPDGSSRHGRLPACPAHGLSGPDQGAQDRPKWVGPLR